MNNAPSWSTARDNVPAGSSAKFHISWRGQLTEAFVLNLGGQYYAYINYCMHAGTPLDWWPNEFFSKDGRFVTCGTHGAQYDPATGQCAGGPCGDARLYALTVEVIGDRIVVTAPV